MPVAQPLDQLLRDEILRHGPLPFAYFMEQALYHPQFGYYTRDRGASAQGSVQSDPFGRHGDYFTASQLQPVFGRLIAAAIGELRAKLREPVDFTVVELGSGRGEIAEHLQHFHYTPVDVLRGELPGRFTGVVFSNEFFDALPVDLVAREGNRDGDPQGDVWKEMLVGLAGERFTFVYGPPVTDRIAQFLDDWGLPYSEEQRVMEVHMRSVEWIERIARCLDRGYVLTIDYGYTPAESIRFPQGTLMSYRRHRASEDVLADPGEQDITSHVPFGLLQAAGEKAGLKTVFFGTLLQFLTELGERGHFPAAVEGGHTQQLKTLLFGMGETFRVLLQEQSRAIPRTEGSA